MLFGTLLFFGIIFGIVFMSYSMNFIVEYFGFIEGYKITDKQRVIIDSLIAKTKSCEIKWKSDFSANRSTREFFTKDNSIKFYIAKISPLTVYKIELSEYMFYYSYDMKALYEAIESQVLSLNEDNK